MAKSKPGRNDLCPCGSGLKFKKCHLHGYELWQRIAEGPTFLDAVEFKIAYCMAMAGPQILREILDHAEALEREYFGHYPSGTILEPDGAEAPLLSWLHRIEEELGKIAASDSRYFWLFLTQRLKARKSRLDGNEQTIHLTRTVLKLAILKYGAPEGTPFTSLPDGYDARNWVLSLDRTALPLVEPKPNHASVPVSVSMEDIWNALMMERLARDYVGATALLRRIRKQGRLPVNEGLPGNALHDPEQDWLIDLYDERLRFARVLSEFGSVVSPEFSEQAAGSKLLCLIPLNNLDERKLPLVWPSHPDGPETDRPDEFSRLFAGVEFVPNYLVVPSKLDDYLRKVELFKTDLEYRHGFPARDFVYFLVALSYRELAWWSERQRRHLQLFQRGYAVIVYEDGFVDDVAWFFQAVAYHFGSKISIEEAISRVAQVEKSLRYGDEDFENINLWDRSGHKLIVPTAWGAIVDFSSIPSILGDFFTPLARTRGHIGQTKGDDFESEVATYLAASIPGSSVVWQSDVIAQASSEEREIDLGIAVGDTLFILECKAHAVHPAFDRGEADALERRKKLNVEALEQADSLSAFLAANPHGVGYDVPINVRHIASAALSPFPEYIDTKSEYWFLDDRVPRVCTPEEIASFISSFVLADHLGSSWLYEVKPREGATD